MGTTYVMGKGRIVSSIQRSAGKDRQNRKEEGEVFTDSQTDSTVSMLVRRRVDSLLIVVARYRQTRTRKRTRYEPTRTWLVPAVCLYVRRISIR
jgi:hypothetical protein